MIIGITGKVGSGKTTLANMLVKKYGLIKLDCDTISKDIQSKCGFVINTNSDGFIDEKEQERITNEFHPLVWNEVEQRIDKNKQSSKNYDYIIETALPSDRFFHIVDISLLIKTDYGNERLKNNRNYSNEKINLINISQKSYDKYYNKCDFVIINNENIDIAFNKICEIYESIKGKT